MLYLCSIGFRSGDTLGQSITFSFSSKAVVILAVCLGWLCWKTVSEGRGSSASECHSTCWNPCFPSMNRSSPVPAVVMQPQTIMLPPPCWTVGKAQHAGHPSQTSLPQTHQTTGHDSSNSCSWPGCLHQTVCRLFVSQLQKRLLFGTTAMQTDLLQCVSYGLSTDKLTFHFCNSLSNAGCTHASVFWSQLLHLTHSTRTQHLWSTFARPVPSEARLVKPLYDPGHWTVTGFQAVTELLIA